MTIRVETYDKTEITYKAFSFSGGERHIQLDDTPAAPKYIIRASLLDSTNIMDLLLLCNALTAHAPKAALCIEIPYLPYARQDRVCAPGQAFSLKVMADLLSTIENVKELIVWDCHSRVFTDLSDATSIDPHEIMQADPALTKLILDEHSVLICPDKGAVNRTRQTAKAFQNAEIVYCEKVRDPATGQITHTQVNADSLHGKTAIITDDICDGGYTFIKVAEQLRAKGADRVILYVTHGIFSKGLGVFDGLIDHIYTTTSFKHAPAQGLTIIQYAYDFKGA